MKDFYTDLVGARVLLSWIRTDSIRSAFKGKPAEQEHLTGTVRAAWIEGAYPRTAVRMLVALDPDPSAKDAGGRALVMIDHTDVVSLLPDQGILEESSTVGSVQYGDTDEIKIGAEVRTSSGLEGEVVDVVRTTKGILRVKVNRPDWSERWYSYRDLEVLKQ